MLWLMKTDTHLYQMSTHRKCKLHTFNQHSVQHQLSLGYHVDTIFAWLILSLRIMDTRTVYLLHNLYADNSNRTHVCTGPLGRAQQCHGHCISHMSLVKLANLAGEVAPGLKLSANAWLHTAHNSDQQLPSHQLEHIQLNHQSTCTLA